MDNTEIETYVGDIKTMDKILKAAMFRCVMVVEKRRDEFEMEGGYYVALDKLGFFLEIENRNIEDFVEERNKGLRVLLADLYDLTGKMVDKPEIYVKINKVISGQKNDIIVQGIFLAIMIVVIGVMNAYESEFLTFKRYSKKYLNLRKMPEMAAK